MFLLRSIQLTASKLIPIAAIIGCSIILQACQPSPADKLQDYRNRIARTLDQDIPAPPLIKPLPFPAVKMLQRETEPLDIGLLDLLALRHCALQTLIAHRNSSLGKVAKPSQQLVYTLQFLQLVPDCIAYSKSNGDIELSAQLSAAQDSKRAALKYILWEAILGAEEYRRFWSISTLDHNYPDTTSSQLLTSLQQLNSWARDWLQGDYQVDSRQLEQALSILQTGDGGALSLSLQQQAAYLEQSDNLLRDSYERSSICPNSVSTKRGVILNTVVSKFWLQGLQRWSADINRRAFELLPLTRDLEVLLASGEPIAFRQWRKQRDLAIDQWLLGPKTHISVLQPVLQRCQQI